MQVKTEEFQFSHGQQPRGRGYWAFLVGDETFWARGTYSEARRAALARAKELGVTSITVLP